MSSEPTAKLRELQNILCKMDSLIVAFSGGVDSTFLLKCAADTLGPAKVVAVTANSETLKAEELERARKTVNALGVVHIVLDTYEMQAPEYTSNTPDRCYHCKKIRFSRLDFIKEKLGIGYIADGANMSDAGDYRPGEKAARELGIRSPLREANLYKDEIRALSRSLGLPDWDMPSQACLASRFPYGTALTPERLKQVCDAERFLGQLGFRQSRVRYHGDMARIEVPAADIERLVSHRDGVVEHLKKLGFIYITLDLQGFRSGSLNEVLDRREKDGI